MTTTATHINRYEPHRAQRATCDRCGYTALAEPLPLPDTQRVITAGQVTLMPTLLAAVIHAQKQHAEHCSRKLATETIWITDDIRQATYRPQEGIRA